MENKSDIPVFELNNESAAAPLQSAGGFRHTVATTTSDSFAVHVRAGQLSWTLDEPEAMGGHGTAPDPVTSFLGALCSCLLISLQITARARQVPLAGASVSAKANEKGFVKTIAVGLTVRSDAPEERVRTVVERAEKGCYIRGLLKESIDYRLDLTILPAVTEA
jgi:putative redox protein